MSKEIYPRIVTNGGRYRIEVGPKCYDQYMCLAPSPCPILYVWETRFVSRAIKRLARMRKDEAHDDPDNWKPVL